MNTTVSPSPCSDGHSERQEPTEAELAELRVVCREARRLVEDDFEAFIGHRPVSEADRAFVDDFVKDVAVQRLVKRGWLDTPPPLLTTVLSSVATTPRRAGTRSRERRAAATRSSARSGDSGDDPPPPGKPHRHSLLASRGRS